MKNSNHLAAEKHPFGVAKVTPRPATATMKGLSQSPGGNIKPGTSANAAMKTKPGK